MPKKRKLSKEPNRLAEKIMPELKIEMINNNEMILDGCKGVIEYDDDYIKLNAGKINVSIKGDDLLISSFDSEIAIISGIISDISFVS